MQKVEEKTHAVMGPSGWHTWSKCPGSIALAEAHQCANTSSSYAREGTAAHALLEECLIEGADAEDKIGQVFVVEGENFVVDMDMADAVNTALAHIRDLIKVEQGDILIPERLVPIGHLTGEEGATGTTDVMGICDGGRLLVIVDYKHGKGVMVAVKGDIDETHAAGGQVPPVNGQLAIYALGSYEELKLIYDQVERVKLVLLQPRINWMDSVEFPVAYLEELAEEVRQAAGRVELNRQAYLMEGEEGLQLVPGKEQCQFCKAKAICPALRSAISKEMATVSPAADFENLSLPKQASSIVIGNETPVERLSSFMRAADLMESAIKAVRAEVERRLFAGEAVPGFKLVMGKKGNRKWADEAQAAKELTKSGRLKADEAYDKTLISPTTAEKLLKKRPKIWAQIAPLITQSDGRPSVAPESDPHEPFQLVPPPSEFQNLTALPSVEDLMS